MFFDTDFLKSDEIYLKCYRHTPQNPDDSAIPCYYFKIHLIKNNEGIGFCDFRAGQNSTTFYSGNIGYRIFEAYQGNHYGEKAVRLLLKLAKLHQMKYLLITCEPKNIASSRTIENSGGKFLETLPLPKDHEMYSYMRTHCNRYKIIV